LVQEPPLTRELIGPGAVARHVMPVLRVAYQLGRVNALVDVGYNDGGSSLAGRGRFLGELSRRWRRWARVHATARPAWSGPWPVGAPDRSRDGSTMVETPQSGTMPPVFATSKLGNAHDDDRQGGHRCRPPTLLVVGSPASHRVWVCCPGAALWYKEEPFLPMTCQSFAREENTGFLCELAA
jgi:hypothetical protein